MVDELTIPGLGPTSLLARAVDGDVDALTRLVAAFHDDMARISFVITADPDLAQEAVQRAWPLAWRSLGSVRDPHRLRSWLVTIAANEARALLRERRRVSAIHLDSIQALGSDREDPGTHIGRRDLADALGRLAPEERQLLAMRHVAGFDATEIGRAMGISPSGVRSRLARLLARLRSELADV